MSGESYRPPLTVRGTCRILRSLGRANHLEWARQGPPDAPAVILLRGWLYDIHAYVEVSALLASAGYRVVVVSAG